MKMKCNSILSTVSNLILLLLRRRLNLLVLRHAEHPVQRHGHGNVEHHEHPQQSKVAPALVERHVDSVQVLHRVVHRAVQARSAIAFGQEIAAFMLHVVCHVLCAALVCGGHERQVFVFGAGDGRVCEGRGYKAVDEVLERVQAIDKDPKAGEGLAGCENTTIRLDLGYIGVGG